MITQEDQLKNKANFLGKNGNLYLVRCMACPNAGERGKENYAMSVLDGVCAWCGWGENDHERADMKKDGLWKKKVLLENIL